MTNCPGLPRVKGVLSTQNSQFKNKESPKQTRKTGLLKEKLPSNVERVAAVLTSEDSSYKEIFALPTATYL